MTQQLSKKRCYNHGAREAIARCPDCLRFFCHECITETEDKVVCSACLASDEERPKKASFFFPRIKKVFFAGCGFLFLWCCFYYLGRILIAIPQSFHDGFMQ